MNNIRKLLSSCRIVISVDRRALFSCIPTKLCCDHPNRIFVYNLDTFGRRTMSQKSITSFFKITPKKTDEICQEKRQEAESPTKSLEQNGTSGSPPVTNGKVKKISKRQRLESSGSEEASPKATKRKSSPVSSQTKKKSKRQRIESSSSEEGGTEKTTQQKIKEDKTVTAESDGSPRTRFPTVEHVTANQRSIPCTEDKAVPYQKDNKKCEEDFRPAKGTKRESAGKLSNKREDIETKTENIGEAKIKTEEGAKPEEERAEPKTGGGAETKTKGAKTKLEETGESKTEEGANSKSEKTGKEAKTKTERTDGGAKPRTGTKEPVKTKKKSPKTKSPVTNKKAKVKEEKISPETKKPAKNVMSFFIQKDVNGKAEEGKETAKVAEEDYNPAKSKYHPIEDACWCSGQEVPYYALAKTLEAIEGTSARLKIVEILANYFRSVIALTPDDLLPSVYMCLNQLAPAYHSLELGIAETYLMKAIGACTGRTLAQVRSAARSQGDLGRVAEAARTTQRTMVAPPKLVLRKVFATLKEIAHMTGSASVSKKITKIQSLYTACRGSEARYLIRSLEGKLRIGLAEQSVLQALAVATVLTPPNTDGVKVLDASKGLSAEQLKAKIDEQALIIKTTYCECPNYELVIPALLKFGAAALPDHCKLTPGIPLKPMLAHPTKGIHEVFNRFENEEFTCEWKYDGERAQIHVPSSSDGKADFEHARIFSRNQEDNTSKYPDVVRRLPQLMKESVTSCVLDTEAVAYDVDNKQILPFQILSTRKRKDASEADIKVQVCVFAFDLLYLNGDPLVRRGLKERRDLLREHFREVDGSWQFAVGSDCSTLEEVQALLDESIKGSCEGLMVKTLTGPHAKYDIARRSHNWLKLKKDYLEGVGDTIDVVVLGAFRGRGKRAGAFGGFLLACYDSQADEYQSLCKIGTGFSDEDLQTFTKTLEEHVIEAPKSYYRFDQSHVPDVWFEPVCVWEIRCADLSLSPTHRAAIGLVDPDKGISLRFPRFVRVREDKSPEQATSAQQIADMYLAQDQVKNQTNKTAAYDDFY